MLFRSFPEAALRVPVSVRPVYERFRTGPDSIDFFGFLEKIHGIASIPSFSNPLHSAGITEIEPYEHMHMTEPLDIARIRRGESKYLIRNCFHEDFRILFRRIKSRLSGPWSSG